MKYSISLSLCYVVAALMQCSAALEMPAIFRDHMVLQRDMPIPIWGEAEPGQRVTAEFGGQVQSATADAQGSWSLRFDPLPASAEPRPLHVRVSDTESATFEDVLVGEVWICAGQSNMEWIMGKLDTPSGVHPEIHFPGVEHGEEEVAKPERADLRIFSDDLSRHWEKRGWQRCGGEALRRFSGTAFFFGEMLQRELRVPVGLINLSRGGSAIQSWTRPEFALRNPYTKLYTELFEKNREQIQAYFEASKRARKDGRPLPEPLPEELEIASRFHGFRLFTDLVEPVAPFAARGVIWYQGESNGTPRKTAAQYAPMLRDLIEGWRDRWGQPQMPWYIVQLPCWNHPESEHWPLVRQGQWEVARNVPNVGLAAICDVADVNDLHPRQKRETGQRLALLALSRTYGRKRVSEGPTVTSLRRDNASLVAEFDNGGAEIEVRGGTWNDVEVAGQDGVFHPARAEVTGNQARVTSSAVPEPRTLRYGWKPVFTPSLFNSAGLPTAPFALTIPE